MHPESKAKALHRRRCFLCAEPVTGISCSRCGHLHSIHDHPDGAAIIAAAHRHAVAARWAAQKGGKQKPKTNSPEEGPQ